MMLLRVEGSLLTFNMFLNPDAAERPSFEDRQIAVGAMAFECAVHAAKAFPEMWKDADRAQYARRQPRPARRNIAWQYRIAGQGERSWRVYAPPHMTADAVQAFAVSILGPLASFFRENTTKRCIQFPVRSSFYWNSRDFGADDLPERPLRSSQPKRW